MIFIIANSEEMEDCIQGAMFHPFNAIRAVRPRWDYKDQGIFYYNTLSYPLALKYEEAYDPHGCGTYYQIPLNKGLEYKIANVEIAIDALQSKLLKYQQMLKLAP